MSSPDSPTEQTKSRRATIACTKCRNRKIKCKRIDNDPYSRTLCERCERNKIQCEYISVQEQGYHTNGSVPSNMSFSPGDGYPSSCDGTMASHSNPSFYGHSGYDRTSYASSNTFQSPEVSTRQTVDPHWQTPSPTESYPIQPSGMVMQGGGQMYSTMNFGTAGSATSGSSTYQGGYPPLYQQQQQEQFTPYDATAGNSPYYPYPSCYCTYGHPCPLHQSA